GSRCSSTTPTRSSPERWLPVLTARSAGSRTIACPGARTTRAGSSTPSATGGWSATSPPLEPHADRSAPPYPPSPMGGAVVVRRPRETGSADDRPPMTIDLPSARSRTGRSRRGGVPTVLPPPGAPSAGQLSLGFDGQTGGGECRLTSPLPDVAHVAHWL